MAAVWFSHQVCLPLLNTFRGLSYPQSEVTCNRSALSLQAVRLSVCAHAHTLTHAQTHIHTYVYMHSQANGHCHWPSCVDTCLHPPFSIFLCCLCQFPSTEAHASCTCCYRFHANELLVYENVEIIRVWGKMFRTLFNWWVWLNREEMFYCAPLFIISTINAFSVIRRLEHYLEKDN